GCCRPARDGRLDRGPGSPVQQARLQRAPTHPDDHGPPAELRIVDPTGPGVESSEALAGKLRTLIQLIELISSSLDTDEILRQIATVAVRLTDARCVSLWVTDEATRTVELRACSDAAIGSGHPSPRLAYGQGVAGWVTLHDEPIKADDLSRTSMVAREWYAAQGLRSLYALPIAYQDSVVGVLVLMAEQPFDLESEEYEILEALIAEAGAAIRNSRLLAESE